MKPGMKKQRGAIDVAVLILLSLIPSFYGMFQQSEAPTLRCWGGYLYLSNNTQVINAQGGGIPCEVTK